MNESFNKKISQILDKFDQKVLKTKMNSFVDMLKNGDTEELAQKINNLDKEELIQKLDELDDSKLKELEIDKSELSSKISESDLGKISQMVGDRGSEIIDRIRKLLK